MAYIDKEHASEIRTELKKHFPKFRFSVAIRDHMALRVTIKSGPVKFLNDDRGGRTINHYHPHLYDHPELLSDIIKVINKKNFDESDLETDYTNVGFFLNIYQGTFEKPYVLK